MLADRRKRQRYSYRQCPVIRQALAAPANGSMCGSGAGTGLTGSAAEMARRRSPAKPKGRPSNNIISDGVRDNVLAIVHKARPISDQPAPLPACLERGQSGDHDPMCLSNVKGASDNCVSPSRARSVRTSPITLANLKPWPEHAEQTTTSLSSGIKSMRKSELGNMV